MTDKEILRREAEARLYLVRDGKSEYERQARTLEELEAIAESVTTHLTDVPIVAKGNSRKDDVWAELADQRSKVEGDLKFYLKAKAELEAELMGLIRKPNIRTAMLYRFINCLSIDDISEAMGYDARNIYYLLRAGKEVYISWYVRTKKG